MKTLDINGDGELSHEEFLKGLKMNSSIAEKMGMTNHELSLQEQGAKIMDMPPDNEDTIFKVPIFLFRARAHSLSISFFLSLSLSPLSLSLSLSLSRSLALSLSCVSLCVLYMCERV